MALGSFGHRFGIVFGSVWDRFGIGLGLFLIVLGSFWDRLVGDRFGIAFGIGFGGLGLIFSGGGGALPPTSYPALAGLTIGKHTRNIQTSFRPYAPRAFDR